MWCMAVIRSVNETVRLGYTDYKFGGTKINNHILPILPKDISQYDIYKYMCLRQWIRANYSRIYHKNANDDMLMYLFMTDVLKLILSDIDANVKESYRLLLEVMLDRRRYASGGVKELDYLSSGNPPSPVADSLDKMPEIFQECIQLSQFPNVKPYTLWFAIVLATQNERLIKSQILYCEEDIRKDFSSQELPKIKNLLDVLSQKLKETHQYNYMQLPDSVDYDYTCYITLDDTTDTGGRLIPAHQISKKVVCNPKFVVSEIGYQQMCQSGENKCPVCHTVLDLNQFKKIGSKQDESKMEVSKLKYYQPYNQLYQLSSDKLTLMEYEKDIANNKSIIPLSEYEFDFQNKIVYQTELPVLRHKMSNVVWNNRTLEQFQQSVSQKYSFLQELDYTNVVIAGGFCRSIMLNQPVNDIDFFFYDLNHEETLKRCQTLIADISDKVETYYQKQKIPIHIVSLTKPKYNVIELLVFQNMNPKKEFNPIVLDAYRQLSYELYQIKKYIYLRGIDLESDIELTPDLVNYLDITDKNNCTPSKILIAIADELMNLRSSFNYFKNNSYWKDETNSEMIQTLEKYNKTNFFKNEFPKTSSGLKKYVTFLEKLLTKTQFNWKTLHKFQIIVSKNESPNELINDFDFPACQIYYDSKDVYLTINAIISLETMTNFIYENKYTDTFDWRLSKYFNYGFDILMPKLDLSKINSSKFQLSQMTFDIETTQNNQLIINNIIPKNNIMKTHQSNAMYHHISPDVGYDTDSDDEDVIDTKDNKYIVEECDKYSDNIKNLLKYIVSQDILPDEKNIMINDIDYKTLSDYDKKEKEKFDWTIIG